MKPFRFLFSLGSLRRLRVNGNIEKKMVSRNFNSNYRLSLILFFFLSIVLFFCLRVIAAPSGPVIGVVGNSTSTSLGPASRSDDRGTITTIVMNVTQQTLYWKAYLGNVSGRISLSDLSNSSIYDWVLSSIAGEVYATRKSSTVSWTDIVCAQDSHVNAETIALNHTPEKSDALNKTFTGTTHPMFYVGNVLFSANECNHTLYTYVGSAAQSSDFSEILLYDSDSGDIVYTTIMNNSITTYNGGTADFQMIVGEIGLEGVQAPKAYYFYVELT